MQLRFYVRLLQDAAPENMAHCLTALISRAPVVDRLVNERSLVSAELRDGWRLVPLDDDDLDSLCRDFSQVADGFTYLSPSLIKFFAELSRLGPAVYIETEYFGGIGSQAAAAFADGHTVPPTPLKGDGSINSALRCVGITTTGGLDEFDHIGLFRYRHTSDWKEGATK